MASSVPPLLCQVIRELLPGTYPFKFVIDDVWSASADYPSMKVIDGCLPVRAGARVVVHEKRAYG